MKRIFIDSVKADEDEVESAEFTIEIMLNKKNLPIPTPIFNQVVSNAWHEADIAWEAVKSADEIYANSSLVPLSGFNSYTGSPVVFDVMMEKAITEDVRGKSVFFMRPFKNIYWEQIDVELLDKAFKHNFIYTLEDRDFVQVDIDKVIRENK